MEHNAFTISSWNIQGLRSSAFGLKSRNPDFNKEIGNTDIVILQETWYKENGPTG
jgi:exonuclease III